MPAQLSCSKIARQGTCRALGKQYPYQAASEALRQAPPHCPRQARLHLRTPQLQRLTVQLMAELHPAQGGTSSVTAFATSNWCRILMRWVCHHALTNSMSPQLLCTLMLTFATAFAAPAASPLCREALSRETLIAGPAVPLAWSRRLNFFCAKPHKSSRSAHA
jgi:hypothetical protein